MKNIDKDTKYGMIVYFGFYFIKLLMFIFNGYLLFKWTHSGNIEVTGNSLIVISIILNILYLIIYNRRLYLLIIGLITFGIMTQDVLNTLVFSLLASNAVAYIIDLIRFIFINLLFKIISLCSRFK